MPESSDLPRQRRSRKAQNQSQATQPDRLQPPLRRSVNGNSPQTAASRPPLGREDPSQAVKPAAKPKEPNPFRFAWLQRRKPAPTSVSRSTPNSSELSPKTGLIGKGAQTGRSSGASSGTSSSTSSSTNQPRRSDSALRPTMLPPVNERRRPGQRSATQHNSNQRRFDAHRPDSRRPDPRDSTMGRSLDSGQRLLPFRAVRSPNSAKLPSQLAGTNFGTPGRPAANAATERKPRPNYPFNRPSNRSRRDLTLLQAEDGTPIGRRRQQRGERPVPTLDRSPERQSSAPEKLKSKAPRPRSRAANRRKPARPRSPAVTAVMYTARMMILGVGVSVLAGTLLSVWDPATQPLGGNTLHASLRSKSEQDSAPSPATERAIALNQEIAPLKAAMQTMAAETTAQVPQLEPTSFLVELGTNQFVDLDGSAAIAAASTIKVPVLIAFFQDVDAGKIRLDESLTLKKEAIGSGSGDIQYLPVGSQFSALDVATRMITISDNTATNMLIARMGGIAGLNQRFQSWGLEATTVRNLLPDLEGTNTTSAKELTLLMARLSQGEFVSLQSRDRILDIMRRTANNSLLPQGLGEGATIAHKTGDIGTVLGDVGLIDLPNGKRYALSVLVKRPFNNGQAGTLIQQLSRISYQHFARSSASLAPAPSDGARDGRARRSRMGEAEDLTGGETRLEESEE